MALTEKQKRFCDEYLIDLNATQAAIRAGYSVKNADKILVVSDGKIVESGTHQELLRKNGKYAVMWKAEQQLSS